MCNSKERKWIKRAGDVQGEEEEERCTMRSRRRGEVHEKQEVRR